MDTYTTTKTTETTTPARKAAVTGLAGVGFVALIVLGMGLAIYSARFVPKAVDGLGSAAVYLGSIFTPSSLSTPPSLAVVPTASTTLPFGDTVATTTTVATTAAKTWTASSTLPTQTVTKTTATSVAPIYYHTVTTTYPTPGSTPIQQGPATYRGLPDLTVKINAVGYLTGNTPDTFVVSPSVPAGMKPAVEFTITNIGTNVAGASRFFASIPTTTNQRYESATQQALNPGDSIQYTLGFDQANTGVNQTISVTTNFDGAVAESNTGNNTAYARITIN